MAALSYVQGVTLAEDATPEDIDDALRHAFAFVFDVIQKDVGWCHLITERDAKQRITLIPSPSPTVSINQFTL